MTINGKQFNGISSFEDLEAQWTLDEVLTALRKYEQQKAYRAEYNTRPETVEKRKSYHAKRNALIKRAMEAVANGELDLSELEG